MCLAHVRVKSTPAPVIDPLKTERGRLPRSLPGDESVGGKQAATQGISADNDRASHQKRLDTAEMLKVELPDRHTSIYEKTES